MKIDKINILLLIQFLKFLELFQVTVEVGIGGRSLADISANSYLYQFYLHEIRFISPVELSVYNHYTDIYYV